jgi:hypothetical protein
VTTKRGKGKGPRVKGKTPEISLCPLAPLICHGITRGTVIRGQALLELLVLLIEV